MSDYRCQHCGSSHPPAAYMYHRKDCPHGKISPERLSEVPTWILEQELTRRSHPAVLQYLLTQKADVMRMAETLSTALVIILQLSRLTRYVRANHTVMNVPNRVVCEIDRVLAERGVVPLRIDDHAD